MRRITAISITPSSNNNLSGSYTIANVERTADGKWSESDHEYRDVTTTEHGFSVEFDGRTIEFVVNAELIANATKILDDFTAIPQQMRKYCNKPTARQPNPQPYWQAFAKATCNITASAGNWQLRPGIKSSTGQPGAETQVWLISKVASTLPYKPVVALHYE
jgi:hypothetical protein